MARDPSYGVLVLCLFAVLTVVGIAERKLAPAERPPSRDRVGRHGSTTVGESRVLLRTGRPWTTGYRRGMKTSVPFLLVVLAASTAASAQTPAPTTPAPSTPVASAAVAKPVAPSRADQLVIDNSRASWEAYKTRNVAAMKALASPTFFSFTLGGPSTLAQDIETIAKLEIASYTIDEPKVTWAGKNVAILRYKNDLKGSFDGKAFKPVYANEVWFNEGGKWRIVSYTETPVVPTT